MSGELQPGRVAYITLLSTTTLGTLSSNLINAPIDTIAADLGASAAEIVLAVSAFTIAMVLVAPIAGWLAQRYGAKRFLLASLGLMIVGQIGASLAPSLAALVAMRAVQGVACSAIPAAIQQTLAAFWAAHRARAMAAWASAIGVGQAIGPPLGGFVADTVGWRGVFLVHALLCVVVIVLIIRFVPGVAPVPRPLHVLGITALIGGFGSFVLAATVAGQDGPIVVDVILLAVSLVLLGAFALIARRNPHALLPPALLLERRFVRSTAAAGTAMGSLGISLVTVPLYLGDVLSPSAIGVIVFVMAVTMAVFAPVSSRIGEHVGTRVVMEGGLVAIVVGAVAMGVATMELDGVGQLAVLVAGLAFTGCGLAATQSVAGLGIIRSPAGQWGTGLGLHNMMRFGGLALGYAWVAITYPTGNLYLTFGGTAAAAAVTLALTVVGGPAAPAED